MKFGASRVGPIPTRLSAGYTGCTLLVDKREIRLLMSRFGFGLASQVHTSSDGGPCFLGVKLGAGMCQMREVWPLFLGGFFSLGLELVLRSVYLAVCRWRRGWIGGGFESGMSLAYFLFSSFYFLFFPASLSRQHFVMSTSQCHRYSQLVILAFIHAFKYSL